MKFLCPHCSKQVERSDIDGILKFTCTNCQGQSRLSYIYLSFLLINFFLVIAIITFIISNKDFLIGQKWKTLKEESDGLIYLMIGGPLFFISEALAFSFMKKNVVVRR